MRRPIAKTLCSVLVAAALLAACGRDDPNAMLASAKDYLAKNDGKAALIQIKNALQVSPDLAEARFLMGKTLLNMGDVAAAEVELQKAADLKYSMDLVLPLKARALNAQGKFKKVIDELAASKLSSADAQADLLTSVALAHLAAGNGSAGQAAVASALAAKADYPPALLVQARMTATSGDLPSAMSQLEKVLALAPKDHEAWKLKGDLFNAQAESGKAIEAYRKSIEARPDFINAHVALVSSLMQQQNADEAAQAFEAMKKIAPKHPRTIFFAGQMAIQKKDFKSARVLAQELLSMTPNNPNALQLAGSVELLMGSWLQAETYLTKAIQLAPDMNLARRMLVSLYLRTGQSVKGMTTLQPLLEKASKDANILALAGEVYLQNGDVNKAADYYAKASALSPKDVPKRTALALTQLLKGDTESAFQDLESLATEDAGTTADMALISAHVRRKDFDKALKAVDGLAKKQDKSPVPHHLRGNILLAKSDFPGARKSFEGALQLSPAYFASAAALAALDMADKKPEDAKKRFESVLVADAKNVQALMALAELRGRQGGTTDEVAALIQKAVAANPTEAGPRVALVVWLLNKKEAKRAVVAAQDAVAALSDQPELLDVLGRAQQGAGETNQALATYAKLAGLQPLSPIPHLRAAEIHHADKNKDAAAQSLRKALSIRSDLIEAMRGLATLNLESGKVREAIDLAREVQKKHPKEAVGYILEGDINISRKAWDEAVAAFRLGLQQAPIPETAIKLHAVLNTHKPREAISLEQSWLKSHPGDVAFRMYLGDAATRKKDFPGAMKLYRAVLGIQPNNAMALNNLAWVAGQQKDPQALEYAEKANTLLPNQPAFMDTLAVILSEKGDSVRAVELMKKALGIAPDAAEIRFNYARVLIRAGDKPAARKEIEALEKLGDKFAGQAEVARLKATL